MSTLRKEASSRAPNPISSSALTKKQFNTKKYSTIRYEVKFPFTQTRKELIRRVIQQN